MMCMTVAGVVPKMKRIVRDARPGADVWRVLRAFATLLVLCAGLSVCGGGGGGSAGVAPAATLIVTQPADARVVQGATANFAVGATGSNLRYQWQSSQNAGASWSDVAGATTASLAVANTTLALSGNKYRVNVSGDNGNATSQAATLTVDATAQAPAITRQPANASVTVPATATFTVVATGTSPLTYQWQISRDNGATYAPIAGATAATFTTAATTLADGGLRYRVVVSNGVGSVTSNAALLTVTQQTAGAGRCATQVLTPGTVIQMTLGSTASAAITTFVGQANGNKIFHGVSAPEVEVHLSDNLGTFVLDTKAYGVLNTASGVVTNFGTLTDSQLTVAGQVIESLSDAVYTPVFVDQRYTLSAGQSISQTFTQAITTTPITGGTPGTPVNTTVTQTINTTFVGNERITVPAGTFDTCKFVDVFSGGGTSSQTTHWVLLDYGVDIQSVSNGGTTAALTIAVNGVPLR